MKVKFDWIAYFAEFRRVHGQPVESRGRLLFRDGWTYSAKDHSGPEWPPPEDESELRKLQLEYWQLRRVDLVRTVSELRLELQNAERTRVAKSGTLYVRVKRQDDSGVARSVPEPWDATALTEQLLWFEQELRECDEKLRELGNGIEERETESAVG